jgi:predicted branched-subunit amino acid permease
VELTATRESWLAPMDRTAFREGVRAMLPMAVAISVWGIVTGVAMVNSGMTVPVALLMTFTVFAGSAQLAVLPLLAVGAPLPVVWLTALVVNLRFVIFAASSRRSFVGLPLRQRVLAGYLNGDLGFALFSRRFADDPERGSPVQWGYFYGGALVNWVTWQAASVVGIVLGGFAPESWGLELAAYLALTAVVVPMMARFPAVAGVASAVVLSVVTVRLPMRLGLVASVIGGVAVALAAETAGSAGERRNLFRRRPQRRAARPDDVSPSDDRCGETA